MPPRHWTLGLTAVALAAALGWRAFATPPEGARASGAHDAAQEVDAAPVDAAADAPAAEAPALLPRLVELGSDRCASCRAMVPVLDELREAHGDRLEVDFIDVWKFPEQAEPFGIRVIPTQVFLDPDGAELARHEGFFAAEGIRARWADLGFPLERTRGS